MSRKKIAVWIVLDLIFLGAVGYRLWTVYNRIVAEEAAAAPKVPLVADIPAAPETPATPAEVNSSTTPVEAPAEPLAVPADSTATATAPTPEAVEPPSVSTETVVTPPAPKPAPAPRPRPPANGPKQAVRFSYFNSKATAVFITGGFNKWTPQPFRKTANDSWSVVLQIAPGDYSYNFVVDGKTIRDPNQRRTDDQGRSLLTVSPPKPPQP